MAEAAAQIHIGTGGRLRPWGKLRETVTNVKQIFIGSSGRVHSQTAEPVLTDERQNTLIAHEALRIRSEVIPRLQNDLRNLRLIVDGKKQRGEDTADVLDPYIRFVLTSLTADHQEPPPGVGSIALKSAGSVITATHDVSKMENDYWVNVRITDNENRVKRLMEGYLRGHIKRWNDLLVHDQQPITASSIRDVLNEQILVGGNITTEPGQRIKSYRPRDSRYQHRAVDIPA